MPRYRGNEHQLGGSSLKTLSFSTARHKRLLRQIKHDVEEQNPFLVNQESDEASGYKEAVLIRAAAELDNANPKTLSEFTHYPLEFVTSVAKRMQEAKIWVDDKPDLQELHSFPEGIWVHVGVARGWLVRKGLRNGSPFYGPGPERDRKPKWMLEAEARGKAAMAGVAGAQAVLDDNWLRNVAQSVVEAADRQGGNSSLDDNQRQAFVDQIATAFGPLQDALVHGECVFCAFNAALHHEDTIFGAAGVHKTKNGCSFICNSWVLSALGSKGQVLPIS